MEEQFIYSVSPRRPIMLSDGTAIRVPKSVLLTKEELKSIIGKAIIYRRFPNGNVKVTTQNIDEVHVAENTAEAIAKAREAKVEDMSKHVGTVTVAEPVAAPVEEKNEEVKVEEPAPVVEEVKEEKTVEESPVAEEVAEPVEEAANEELKGEETKEDAPAEEVVEDTKTDSNKENKGNNTTIVYNNNKKKNRNNN